MQWRGGGGMAGLTDWGFGLIKPGESSSGEPDLLLYKKNPTFISQNIIK
jgi:hypothetical protein